MSATIQLATTAHQEGRLDEAEQFYKTILESQPEHLDALNNLGALLLQNNRFEEAEEYCKKAIELKPDFAEAHNNLGVTLNKLSKPAEAEAYFKKAIKLKPDYAEAYYNLGNILHPLYGRLNEVEACYKKAIEINPDHPKAYNNLEIVVNEQDLLLKINEAKKLLVKNKSNNIDSRIRLTSNPFIIYRAGETELLKDIRKISFREFDKQKKEDARFGNGKCSDFKFFENNFSSIKILEEELITIMSKAVKSEIYILESFLNIYGAGSGLTPHHHISHFDKVQELIYQKYSLVYYLSVGDQNCSEPGILRLYDPEEEILPSEGEIVIFPASRSHSSSYNGKTDRVMIGVNFYSLL